MNVIPEHGAVAYTHTRWKAFASVTVVGKFHVVLV